MKGKHEGRAYWEKSDFNYYENDYKDFNMYDGKMVDVSKMRIPLREKCGPPTAFPRLRRYRRKGPLLHFGQRPFTK